MGPILFPCFFMSRSIVYWKFEFQIISIGILNNRTFCPSLTNIPTALFSKMQIYNINNIQHLHVVLCKYGTESAVWITSLLLPWWCSDFANVCPSRTLRPRMQWRWLWGAQPAALCHVPTLLSQVQEQHKVSAITADPESSGLCVLILLLQSIWLSTLKNENGKMLFSPHIDIL